MRVLVCDPMDDLTTALLQEGHPVHVGKPDRAARRFVPDIVVIRYVPGHFAGAWFTRRQHLPLCVIADIAPRDPLPFFDRITWRAATRVFAASTAVRDAVAAIGIDDSHIEIFPTAATPEYFLPPPFAPTRTTSATILGWFGGSAPASLTTTDLALTVIADDVPRVRVADLIAGIDIALHPHASPLRLIDCMAGRRAIVAPDTQAVRDLLEHERTSLLFDPADDGAILRAAARLIADPALRTRLGEAAHSDLIRRDLTWRGLARRIAAAGESA